ncbi:MAG: transcription antitermination factor NusB [Melioribacteraceae bacterium]|nr:transcription antitermination factor NusB [Melioribacteraceae bacterium]
MFSAKKSKRRIARELVLKVLYAYKMNGDGIEILMNAILADLENGNDKDFARELIYKILANTDLLEEKITERVTNWEMDRIAVIDRLLLQMGICEILYFNDIPPKVSINEAIEIAKEYSTSNSGKFINGILDAVLSDLRKSGSLKKSGRGLIDESFTKQNQ